MDKNLESYIEFLKSISLNNDYLYCEEISGIEEMLNNDEFNIAVIGEFSVGKSTFLNALMGERILFSAMQEATGVSTKIINSDKRIARVIFDNDDSIKDEIIDLTDIDVYKKLGAYLNREKLVNKSVKGIEVEYPIEYIHRNVAILDTPGLGGLTGRESEIAKKTLNVANMSILVIGNQGIKDSELQFLLGNNELFGKIKTQEIVVVMNKIGEYFDKYALEVAIEKIKRSKENVEAELLKNNIKNVQVLAIDSRDYLWSRDKKLYDIAKEKEMVTLSQEEYKERSNFDEFIKYLELVTRKDYKEKIIFEEARENILVLLEEFRNEYKNIQNKSGGNIQDKIKIIENRKINLIDNRKKIVNAVKRQVKTSTDDFGDLITSDIAIDIKNIKKQLIKEIDKISDLNSFTVNKEIEILNDVDKKIETNLSQYNKQILGYKNMIFEKVLDTFDKKVKLAIKANSLEIKYKMDFDDIENDELKNIRKDYNSILSSQDERVLKLKEDLAFEKNKKEKLIFEQKDLNSKKMIYDKKSIEDLREKNKQNLNREITVLGSQPEPRAVYSYNEVKKGIWPFRKTVTVKEFDYFDYSECEKWMKDREKIYIKYNNIDKDLDKRASDSYEFDNRVKRNINRLSICEKEINAIESELIYLKNKHEEKINKYHDRMLDKAKISLNEKILIELSKKNNSIIYQLQTVLDNLAKSINNEVEIKGNEYLENYNMLLTGKYDEFKKELNSNKNIAEIQILEIDEKIKALA